MADNDPSMTFDPNIPSTLYVGQLIDDRTDELDHSIYFVGDLNNKSDNGTVAHLSICSSIVWNMCRRILSDTAKSLK